MQHVHQIRNKVTLGTWAAQTFGLVGICATHLTPQANVRALLRTLYPIAPGIELIRLGPDTDGGYLVPDDLQSKTACCQTTTLALCYCK